MTGDQFLLMSTLVEPGVRGGNDLGEFPLCRPVVALTVDLKKGGRRR